MNKHNPTIDIKWCFFMPQEIHTPYPSPERGVYGFSIYVATYTAMVLFLLWAFLPDEWLRYIGFSYFPQKFWAIALPTYILVGVAVWLVGYVGATLLLVPTPDSIHTLTDEYTHMATTADQCLGDHDNKTIPPIRDIPITIVNKQIFGK